jgi:hypothetical protein
MLISLQRENFMALLEHREEHKKVTRVLTCFNKSGINPHQSILRDLK